MSLPLQCPFSLLRWSFFFVFNILPILPSDVFFLGFICLQFAGLPVFWGYCLSSFEKFSDIISPKYLFCHVTTLPCFVNNNYTIITGKREEDSLFLLYPIALCHFSIYCHLCLFPCCWLIWIFSSDIFSTSLITCSAV